MISLPMKTISVLEKRFDTFNNNKDAVTLTGLSEIEKKRLMRIIRYFISEDGITSPSRVSRITLDNIDDVSSGIDESVEGFEKVLSVLDFFWNGIGYCIIFYKDGSYFPYNWDFGSYDKEKVSKMWD